MKLSSDNKRILVCGDVHHQTYKLHSIIKQESPDFIVVLGDWFDSHIYDTLYDCEKTAKYLKKFIFQDNTVTLWGNHDLHYFFTNKNLQCSGYTMNKDLCITDALDPVFNHVKERFQWYIWVDDYLCTHAGLHPRFIPPHVKTNDDIDNFLNSELEKIHTNIISSKNYWAYGAGRARYGSQSVGGITWLDFVDEFEPIDGLKQIVGHTFSRNNKIYCYNREKYQDPTQDDNICVDANLDEYLVIHNGKLTIKQYINSNNEKQY